ncbi:MAG: bifunctional proline dehydrogenase/L-glutamate gamma-semialdehyde dehydrogenase [Actinomycetota bacterium]
MAIDDAHHPPVDHGARTAEPATNDDLGALTDRAVELAARWLTAARQAETGDERRTAARLNGVVDDADGVAFALHFVDRVMRPDDDRTAAQQLASLLRSAPPPGFLGPIDRLLLRAGAALAPAMPSIVMPLARRRMRALTGHLGADADDQAMGRHFAARRNEGFSINVNLLGEAVLGEREANRRYEESIRLLRRPDVDYVSVKVSAIVSQLNPWDHAGSVARVSDRLRPLLREAAATSPPTFVNLDMEEYHDLELTLEVFMALLEEPELHAVDAGIVLQAYLPDSFPALQRLTAWAGERRRRHLDGKPGGVVKVRLVKGANLAMERVDAAIHGWPQAPYRTKAETDANYKRCLDWLLRPEHLDGVRVGVASHNLFDCCFAHLLATERGVADRITLEMLEGMAPAQARVARNDTGDLLLYTPAVAAEDFDVAISYLFRRLEENTADENFIRHLFALTPESDRFTLEADTFRTAVADRWSVGTGPQRGQDRRTEKPHTADGAPFANEPDTDPTLAANRAWADELLARPREHPSTPITDDTTTIDAEVATATAAQPAWWALGGAERRRILRAVGDELARRRGDLMAAMANEGHKTVAQADPEVSEAVDFARYYADRSAELPPDGFEPLGVVLVVPPWNFPVAIPAGGVLASLAAGNAVVFKPAPETPRCAEIVAECCWAAGVPPEVLRFVRTPDNETGRHLVTHDDVGAVILTGAYETAELFRSWKPDLRLLAETSGKNALVITPAADVDLAVADLVASAFGHSGQKCSAASLAIAVGDVYDSPRFRRQLVDAVASLTPGRAIDVGTDVAPTIAEPEGKLLRALTELQPGEDWLVEPQRVGEGLWTPGVRVGVSPDSWFHRTECFGPVLGIMAAPDLDTAIELQNATAYGLTGGIHSLDDAEIDHWLERVEVGNAYVNRVTTGAIVQRQPFGGWKRSSVGPGAKAGGPNYVAQLGTWSGVDRIDDDALAAAIAADDEAWRTHFGIDHDPTALFCEENTFRYRPRPVTCIRIEDGVDTGLAARARSAAERAGVGRIVVSTADDETQEAFAARLSTPSFDGLDRIRVLGPIGPALRKAANDTGIHLADDPVTVDHGRELLHHLREQAISRTRHRYGNVL